MDQKVAYAAMACAIVVSAFTIKIGAKPIATAPAHPHAVIQNVSHRALSFPFLGGKLGGTYRNVTLDPPVATPRGQF